MKTRISKHGKYMILEGTEGEVKDTLQPGDRVTWSIDGTKNKFEIVQLIHNREEWAAVKDGVEPVFADVVEVGLLLDVDDEYFDDPFYLIRGEDSLLTWPPVRDGRVKVKRRIQQDSTITGDTVRAEAITSSHVNEEPSGLPDKQGLWRDDDGNLWAVDDHFKAQEIKHGDSYRADPVTWHTGAPDLLEPYTRVSKFVFEDGTEMDA